MSEGMIMAEAASSMRGAASQMREAASAMSAATDMFQTVQQLNEIVYIFKNSIDKLAQIEAIKAQVAAMDADGTYTEEGYLMCRKELEALQ